LRAFALALLFLLTAPRFAQALDIQRVVSRSGIEAWLVEEHAVPVIAVEVGFKVGAASDPPGKEGLAAMLAGLLDEGAGKLDSLAFRKRLDDRAIRLSFSSGRNNFSASLATLSEHRKEAFRLLRLALTKPRFDDEPMARIRSQLLARLARQEEDPDEVASIAWFAAAFREHPYGRPVNGTAASLEAITRADLETFLVNGLTRNRMKIAVVGNIGADDLARLLDRTFGALPERGTIPPIPETQVQGDGSLTLIRREIPQTVVVFGGPGLKRHDPDFYAAYVLNYIVGGGGFSSRLTEEVREKRGLAYSVYSFLMTFNKAGAFYGGLATENKSVKDSIALVKAELRRVLRNGVTERELESAKTYLTGSYPLRFDSNAKIADELVGIQLLDLGIDYVENRNALIEAVTMSDLVRVATRFLDPERFVITVVGDPVGLP
jgi:zinc protease